MKDNDLNGVIITIILMVLFGAFAVDLPEVAHRYYTLSKMNVEVLELFEDGYTKYDIENRVKQESSHITVKINGISADNPSVPVVYTGDEDVVIEISEIYTWKPLWGLFEVHDLTMLTKRKL